MAERCIRRVNDLKKSSRLKGVSWEYYEAWLDKKAPGTQENYLLKFVGFLEYMDTDTEGLYKLYLEMIRDEDPRKKKRMSMYVFNYQKHLMETKGVKGISTRKVCWAVKGFFKANSLTLEIEEKIQDDSEEIPTISKEQIRKVLSATGSYKMKAVILLARDSGLRVGDITKLPIRILREALDNSSIEYYTFEWKQRKTKKFANPVIGPECLQALRTWMNYRVKKLKVSADDGDPLFCVEKTTSEFTTKFGIYVKGIVIGDWISEGSLGTNFSLIMKKADLKPLPGGTRLPSIHSLRKYHWTTLQYAGVPTTWVEKMQGRKGVGTGGIYTKPNPEQLIEYYSKAYATLSGIEEGQHEKIETLTHELGQSQYENAELRKERDRYRAEYESRIRLQSIIDKARLEGWPEEIIKKLEENLESVETFEDGVVEFHKLKREIELEEERSEDWDFKMVDDEAEMMLNARDGWEVFKALNDGKYFLRRQL